MWQGSVTAIHIAAAAGQPMVAVDAVRAVPGRGLEGDRYFLGAGYYSNKPGWGGREVTLIETEAVAALGDGVVNADGERLGIVLTSADTRRNIATAGVPLNHLVGRRFTVGEVLMEGTRLCEPCKYLEGLTRPGVMGALVHRGGLRAKILTEGVLRPGDPVRPA